MYLTYRDLDFLTRAIHLKEAVLDFDVEDDEFKASYGCTPAEYRQSLKRLSTKTANEIYGRERKQKALKQLL